MTEEPLHRLLNWCEYFICYIFPSHLILPSSTLISAKCVFVKFAIALQSMQSEHIDTFELMRYQDRHCIHDLSLISLHILQLS